MLNGCVVVFSYNVDFGILISLSVSEESFKLYSWGFIILDPPKTYTQDGVCLTESGMTQLQSLTVTVPRRKRTKPKLKLKIINQNSVAVLQTPPDIQSEHSRDGEMDDSRGNTHLFSLRHICKN